MFTGVLDPDLESHLLQEQLAIFHREHPIEAALIERIMDALDYEKTAIRGELRVRGMVLALGNQLAKRSDGSVERLYGWLAHFVKDGALTQKQATLFTVEIRALFS
ncbi:hypothetical protein [Pseudomonas sp. TWRC1-2]|uniref:hypothetical protein n=1 Tax=Pseudomonas sp. TWRC1-2 TaxID=2804628 RepID=UPI003CF6FC23